MPQAGGGLNNRKLFLTDLEAGSPGSRCQQGQCLVKACRQEPSFFQHRHRGREGQGGSKREGGKKGKREISSSFYIGASQVALVVKNPSASVRDAGDARDVGSIPGSGRPPGEANGNPLQYSCLENPMDRGTWWATIHGVRESDMTRYTQNIYKTTNPI